ncbi:MAG: type VI secretion system-associated FHA domain protein TagH [Gammaproteobacteria bacterium]
MRLLLQIVSQQRQALGATSLMVFGQQGGSIGRGQDNDWVLPDEERYLSSRHALIRYRNDIFYLEDVSTNGVYINDSAQVVGKGGPVALNDGDRLRIGDYEIQATIERPPESEVFPDLGLQTQSNIADEADPLRALDSGRADRGTVDQDDPFAGLFEQAGAEPDHVSSQNEFFKPPEPVAQSIPDNWDETGFGAATPPIGLPQQQAHGRSPMTPQEEHLYEPASHDPEAHRPHLASTPMPTHQPAGQPDGGLQAFFSGAGLDESLCPASNGPEALVRQGAIFREMIEGLMDVLRARATVKSTFRMPVTTIKPVENNPLKFPIGVDEALRYLLAPQGSGYLPADAACREGFQDLKDHQLAMMAGLQAALRALLTYFDPKTLEADFSKKLGLLKRGKSAYWDCYAEFYRRTVRDSVEDNFQSILGEAFASAYEEQIRRLQHARVGPRGHPDW